MYYIHVCFTILKLKPTLPHDTRQSQTLIKSKYVHIAIVNKLVSSQALWKFATYNIKALVDCTYGFPFQKILLKFYKNSTKFSLIQNFIIFHNFNILSTKIQRDRFDWLSSLEFMPLFAAGWKALTFLRRRYYQTNRVRQPNEDTMEKQQQRQDSFASTYRRKMSRKRMSWLLFCSVHLRWKTHIYLDMCITANAHRQRWRVAHQSCYYEEYGSGGGQHKQQKLPKQDTKH